MILMKKKLALSIALSLASVGVLSSSAKVAHAADTSVRNKMVMHTATAYDKDRNSTDVTYNAFSYAKLLSTPVKIDGTIYYKVADKDQYLKATNIDGVTRRITHNTYIYSTSTRRTSYQNQWKLYKGQTITTYGGSYKFKNGKSYFRIGGPSKQYVKSYNLGPIVAYNANVTNNATSKEETTVTVTAKSAYLFTEVPGKIAVQPTNRRVKKGDKFIVDRLEQGSRADTGRDGDDDNELAIYHIKGTNYWIYNFAVKAAKQLPIQNYYKTNKSQVTMNHPVEVYNTDGTSQNIKIKKNDLIWIVDKELYIWIPKANKAELFYHLHLNGEYRAVYRLTSNNKYVSDRVPIKNAYVKVSDVQFDKDSKALTPSNTPEEAKAAALKK